MTRADHRTGTERIAEVAAHEEGDVFVNVQGDEPLVDPVAIECRGRLAARRTFRPDCHRSHANPHAGDIMDPKL